jgi:hypothetical protein
MGDERVKNWLVSLTISTLFGFLVTLPIQVIKKNLLSNVQRKHFVTITLPHVFAGTVA